MTPKADITDKIIERLIQFAATSDGVRPKIIPFNRLFDILAPKNSSQLVKIISYLMDRDVIKQVVRVVSPKTGAGIYEYDSISEVPDIIHDYTTDEEIHDAQDHIEILYKIEKIKLKELIDR